MGGGGVYLQMGLTGALFALGQTEEFSLFINDSDRVEHAFWSSATLRTGGKGTGSSVPILSGGGQTEVREHIKGTGTPLLSLSLSPISH